MKTLREEMSSDTRTKRIRLIDISGQIVEVGDRDYIVNKYADKLYSHAYSCGRGEVDIWIIMEGK